MVFNICGQHFLKHSVCANQSANQKEPVKNRGHGYRICMIAPKTVLVSK